MCLNGSDCIICNPDKLDWQEIKNINDIKAGVWYPHTITDELKAVTIQLPSVDAFGYRV